MQFNFRTENGDVTEPPDYMGQFITPNFGRIVKWGLVIIGLIFLFVLISFARGIYTDWLWFDHLGFKSVFVTILTTKIWLFFAGALVSALLLSANLVIAHRFSQGPGTIPLPPESIDLLRRLTIWGIVLAIVLISIIFGSVTSGRWESLLRFMNSVPFGQIDPVFDKDISFYVFTLPVLHLIQGWLLGIVIVSLLASAAVYFVNLSLRGVSFSLIPAMRVHASILGAALLFVIAWGHWLDRWELLYSPGGAVSGATYADIHARLPVLVLLSAIAVASGILMLMNAYFRGIRLLVGALALWIAVSIIGGAIYPGAVQRFSVEPNEFVREEEFIDRNIKFTRQGYALDRIEEQSFPAEEAITASTVAQNRATIDNIRIWDHRPLKDTYNQIQFIRLYYDFLDVDVDRYTLDGEYRQVMLGARELSPENLPPEAQRWVNQKLQYTHGFGLAMSPVTEFTPEGAPEFFVQDIPPEDNTNAGDLPIDNPRIYYGENTKDFVIVNSKTEEFDFPTVGEAGEYISYTGQGGVRLSSLLRKTAYAWQMGDFNILISGEITPDSRIQYHRQIQERVEAVAPFLLLDSDPYMVVADGRLFWIQDTYTVTDRYPYSDLSPGGFNYIRNSVKVVIDAFSGTMDFYIADEDDPLIKNFQKIFPDLFLPMDQMPSYLRDHLRYPEDFFKFQAEKYLTYHMRQAQVFYNKEDQWSVPTELFYDSLQTMEPYYLIMRLPGEDTDEFVLLMPFTPSNRPNLVAWLAARSDGENYGKLKAFIFPKDKQVDGPSQIEARIDNDPLISQQFTLWGQVGSTIIRGNLLVIPIGESILYVEPIFLQAQALTFPELKRVITVSGNKVVMEETLEESLAVLIGAPQPPTVTTPPTTPPTEPPSILSPSEELKRQIEAITQGLGEIQGGLSSLEEALERLRELTQGE